MLRTTREGEGDQEEEKEEEMVVRGKEERWGMLCCELLFVSGVLRRRARSPKGGRCVCARWKPT